MTGKRLDVPQDEEALVLHGSWLTMLRTGASVGVLALIVWVVVSSLRELVLRSVEGLYQLSTREGATGVVLVLVVMGAVAAVRGALMRKADWRLAIGDGVAIARERASTAALGDGFLPSLSLAVRKLTATVLTLGGGGSGGLEAPVVLISESLGASLAILARVPSLPGLRLAQICGVSAGMSTLLGAPFTAALFTLELLHGERIVYRKLAYALWAAVIPFWLNTTLNGYRPLFVAPPHSPEYSLPEYGASALVAIAIAAPLALGFSAVMRWSRTLLEQVQPGWHAVSTMLVIGGFALGLQRFGGIELRHVLSGGEDTLRLVLHNDPAVAVWWVLLMLIVAKTATLGLTLGGGGSAGMLFPSMFLGGLSGALVAHVVTSSGLATLDPALFAVVGIASSLTAVVGVPIAAMALVFEVFGKAYGPPTILACGLTYLATLRFRRWAQEGLGDSVSRLVSRLASLGPRRPAGRPASLDQSGAESEPQDDVTKPATGEAGPTATKQPAELDAPVATKPPAAPTDVATPAATKPPAAPTDVVTPAATKPPAAPTDVATPAATKPPAAPTDVATPAATKPPAAPTDVATPAATKPPAAPTDVATSAATKPPAAPTDVATPAATKLASMPSDDTVRGATGEQSARGSAKKI